ncbi:hypothetical protein HAX54_031912 [Datura stramonium]|uniref:Uncharacterized protein n=1 Tax=Datura stramonium TaxID=4076 RepID=A0ABS8SD28_DATST|nr:hypothetical protein [Datura stramonium]
MEQLLSSLVFSGSIIEAITEAKQQKKLFVVFVSGSNMESNQLETSTWLDPRVADSISKYCILLHILEGSTDARNFSALWESYICLAKLGDNRVIVKGDPLPSRQEA